jgi:hypothetical protein
VDTQFIYLIRQQIAGLTGQTPSGLGFLLVSVRFIFWCWGLFALVIVGLVVYSRTRAQGRTKTMVAVAQELGFTFKGTNPDDETQLLQMAPTLLKGGSRCSNIMTGTAAGLETSIFDFLDSFIARDASNRNASTVAAFRQNLSLPYFEMEPAPILNRYLSNPRFIHFESHPDFVHRYLLNGPNQDQIRELFSPALLTFLLGLPPQNKLQIKGDGAVLILYRQGTIVRANKVRSFLDQSSSIARAFFSLSGFRKPSA